MSSSTFDLLFRTTDATKWGDGKGAPLNAGEVDLNFWFLLQLYLALEENPIQPKEIADITVTNNQMTITLNDTAETTFGPFTLPVATLSWKNNWTPATDYKAFDIVTANQGLYLVLQDITSDATFDPDASNLAGAIYKLILQYPVAFDIGFFFPGLIGTGIADGSPIFQYRPARSFFLNANLPDTVAGLFNAPDADLSFNITKNGATIGTLAFVSGSTDPDITFADDVQFDVGDVLGVSKPASIDDLATDLTVTFAATKGTLVAPSSS